MDDLEKTISFIDKYKPLLNTKVDDVRELITKINNLKFNQATLLVNSGMKVQDAMKETNISAGKLKKLNRGSIYFNSKMNYDYKPPINNNKGKKRVLKNGELIYMTENEYNNHLANGKIIKTKPKKIQKQNKFKEINCGSIYIEEPIQIKEYRNIGKL